MKNVVDIILPTYNGSKYISNLLDSILNQSFCLFKILIRDDSSKDNTKDIIERYAECFPNKIVIIKDDLGNLGVTNNIFEILKYSQSNYIMFCDQDDIWFENKIEILLKCIKKKEKYNKELPILVHSEVMVTDDKLVVMDNSFSHYNNLDRKRTNLSNLLQKNIVQGASSIFNKSLLSKANKLIQVRQKQKIYHDHWFAVLASAFGKIYFYAKPLMYYRQHRNNLVGARKSNRNNFVSPLFFSYSEDIKYNYYLTVNSGLCKALFDLYREELDLHNIEIIKYYKSNPSDIRKFIGLRLYKYYNLSEIVLRAVTGVDLI